jgi:Domain of unknown function (DUF4367)
MNMKQIFAPLLVSSLFVIACNNDKPKESITVDSKDGKEHVTIDPTQLKDAAQDMLKRKEELEKLTPLTADELKALVPGELLGAATSDIDMNAAMGTTVATANYKINDSVDLKLEIVDCAGPGGAGMFSMQYLGMINLNSDDEDEYVKTIDFNGGKAFEKCKKNKNRCTIVWFSSNRFLVSLRGDNVGIDALKDLAKGLKIK